MEPKFEPKQYTPEEIAELEKQRKDYDKQATKDARNKNSLVENLTGRGVIIDKEDIVRIDANRENAERKGVKNATDGKLGQEEVLRGPRNNERQRLEFRLADLDREQKSTLTVHYVNRVHRNDLDEGGFIERIDNLEGLIDGKKVFIKMERDNDRFAASGTIDGEKITAEFAQRILEKYLDTAIQRTNMAFGLKKGREEVRLDEKKEIEYQKDVDEHKKLL